MAEAANPATGANQEPPDIQQRMESFLTRFDAGETEEPEQPSESPAQAAQPEGQADEPTLEDVPDEVPAQPSEAGGFEIVHNGQQRKLSR